MTSLVEGGFINLEVYIDGVKLSETEGKVELLLGIKFNPTLNGQSKLKACHQN